MKIDFHHIAQTYFRGTISAEDEVRLSTFLEESAKMDQHHPLGIGRAAIVSPLFDRKRIQPDSKCTNDPADDHI